MTLRKTVLVGLALSVVGAMSVPAARGDDFNQKTTLTFTQPFEIPGHVLPAGTYIFQLADTMGDRHVVQVRSGDDKKQIALVLAIANSRLEPAGKTIITFGEVPVGTPETIRAWFYPGRTSGQEFVYPKRRALELAALSKVDVPSMADDSAEPDLKALKAAPIVAMTADQKETPVATAGQTTPMPEQTVASASATRQGTQLPQTASPLFLIVLVGFASFGVAAALLVGGKLGRRSAPVSVR
jgi:hypothetical protein